MVAVHVKDDDGLSSHTLSILSLEPLGLVRARVAVFPASRPGEAGGADSVAAREEEERRVIG